MLILATASLSLWSNRGLLTHSQVVDRLDSHEKLYLTEALHLKQTLGESLWPGWGRAEIPLLAWNEQYGFLVGEPNPPPDWQQVAGDTFLGKPYYRLQAVNRQAFATLIGDRWVASIGTKDWMQVSFVNELSGKLPQPLKPVFPYRLVVRFFSLNSSDLHVAAVLHESFHAYQAERAPNCFAEAQEAYRDDPSYPWKNPELQRSWKSELELLAQAVTATSNQEASDRARWFLDHRRQRRQQYGLDAKLVAYERHMEWLEGLAKYVELAAWREASQTPTYKPLPELAADRDFQSYATFPRHWSGELTTMKWQASKPGDIRFYYTGMAQAFLLDRLRPGWKARILGQDMWLEVLLAEATEKP